MIRATAPRASQLAKFDLPYAPHLDRSKTFVKRVDKNNDVYYTLAKKGLAHNPDPDKEYEFFEMPNLLLDLDADGTRHVRSVEDTDEKLMKTKWAEVPRRTEVKARLKSFEDQVYESRRKAYEVLSQPTNIWRITPHDIVSAALQGGPGPQRKSARASSPSTIASEPMKKHISSSNSGIIDKIRLENGIPPHANNEDQLLLQWMILRHKSLLHTTSNHKSTPPSPTKFIQALQEQTTVVGVRRLVFQCISAGTNISSFQKETKADINLPRQIRDTCARILNQDPSNRDLHLQTLTFLGNLSGRLSSLGMQLGSLLCGMALKLSAEIGSLEAISGWLYRSNHTTNPPNSKGKLLLEDVLSTLTTLHSILNNETPLTFHEVEQRQLLFQLLTGIDENDAIASDSFRVVATTVPKENSSPSSREVYTSYIALLGHLGAARTLWREWRELPSSMSRDDNVVLGFCNALKQAVRVMPATGGEPTADPSLDECATLDYHAIEMQDVAAWRAGTSDSTTAQVRVNVAACRSALDLPLTACMKEVRTW